MPSIKKSKMRIVKITSIPMVKYNYEYIKKEILENKNNVINHSCICFTKKFWNSLDKYNNKLRYRNDKPFEDLSLWYRAIDNNIKIEYCC